MRAETALIEVFHLSEAIDHHLEIHEFRPVQAHAAQSQSSPRRVSRIEESSILENVRETWVLRK